MVRAQLADGTVLEFPDGTPDDVVDRTVKAHLSGAAPAEAAPEPEKEPQGMWARGIAAEKKRLSEFTEAFKGRAPGALYDATIGLPGAVLDAVKLAFQPTGVPGAVIAAAGGEKDLGEKVLGLQGAKGTGEAVAGLLPGVIPVGGLMGKAAQFAKSTRGTNVLKAVGAKTPGDVSRIRDIADRIDLPVTLGKEKLLNRTKAQIAEVGTELDAAKAGLADLPQAPVGAAIKKVKAERPVVSRTTKKGELIEASGDTELVAALDKKVDDLVAFAGQGRSMKPADIQVLKEQFQSSAQKAYTTARETGQDVGAGAEASEKIAAILRETLETSPGIP